MTKLNMICDNEVVTMVPIATVSRTSDVTFAGVSPH